MPRAADACSTRSPARARRSSRRSRAGATPPAVDIAAFNCLLMRVKTAEYNLFTLEHELARRAARGSRPFDASRPPRPTAYVATLVRAAGRGRAARLPLADRATTSTRTSCASCSPARPARRGCTTHFDLDFPREPQGERVLVPQAPARRAGRSSAPSSSCAATRSTRSRGSGLLARARAGPRGDGPARGRPRARARRPVRRRRHLAAVPGPDRLPRAAPLRLRAARPRRPPRAELGAAARGHERAAIGEYVDGIAASSRTRAASLRPGARVVIVVNDRRELYPEILERAGLRLESAPRATSTAAPAVARASTSRTCSSRASRVAARAADPLRVVDAVDVPAVRLAADAVVVDARRDHVARRPDGIGVRSSRRASRPSGSLRRSPRGRRRRAASELRRLPQPRLLWP